MPSGIGYGASQGLEQVLADMYRKAMLNQQAQQAQASQQLQGRSLDLTERGQNLSEGRFQTGRADEQAAATAAAQKQAAEMAALEEFAGSLPGHLQAPVRGKARFGVSITPEQMIEAPETREARDAREFGDFEKREGVQQTGRFRLLGAQQAGAKELEGLRQSGALQLEGARQSGKQKPETPASSYSAERGTRISESVDDLIGRVGNTTAGVGSVLANLPATAARDFAADLDKLKANIAFSELTEMREASKTGGALGQVSNIELGLLQSALGALDPGQSPANLVKNLKAIKEVSARWQRAKAAAGGGVQNGASAQIDNDPLGLFKK